MAVGKRPGFTVNVERTSKSVASKSIYLDINPSTTVNLRFTPTSNEDGQLFFESSQHFRFTEKGEKRAWACLDMHGDGTEACPICQALANVEVLDNETKMKKLLDDHGASNRWHAQVIPVNYEYKPDPENEGEEIAIIIPATQSFVVGLSKTTAQKIANTLKRERDNRKPLLTNVEKGQIIAIERNGGSGFATRYEVIPTGERVNLDALCPLWEDKYLDLEKALKLRIVSRQVLIESMSETLGPAIVAELLDI